MHTDKSMFNVLHNKSNKCLALRVYNKNNNNNVKENQMAINKQIFGLFLHVV